MAVPGHPRGVASHDFFLGIAFIGIAGLDADLLRNLNTLVRASPLLADNWVFRSELSVSLYLLPALLAGVGVNICSHVLIRHLDEAQARYAQEHREHA